jgi:hypothetical protein
MSGGRPVKRHASGDPFVAREILKRHATFPRLTWRQAEAAVAEALVLGPAIDAALAKARGEA